MAGLLLGFFLTAAGDRPGAVPFPGGTWPPSGGPRGIPAAWSRSPSAWSLSGRRGSSPWIILASAAFARWGEAPSAPMGRAKKYPMGNSP